MGEVVSPGQSGTLSQWLGDADLCYLVAPSAILANGDTPSVGVHLSEESIWTSINALVSIAVSESEVAGRTDGNAALGGVVSEPVCPGTTGGTQVVASRVILVVPVGTDCHTAEGRRICPLVGAAVDYALLS